MSLRIDSVTHIKDYTIRVMYTDGVEQKVDLKSWIKSVQWHPANKPYLKIDEFKKFYLDEQGLLCWGENDLVLSAAALRLANTKPKINQKSKFNSSTPI